MSGCVWRFIVRKDAATTACTRPFTTVALPSHRCMRVYASWLIPQLLAMRFIWAPNDRGMRLIIDISAARFDSSALSSSPMVMQRTFPVKKAAIKITSNLVVFAEPLQYR